MDQTVRRSSHQSPADLNRDFQNQFCIKRAVPPYASLQGFALDQLHCVIAATAIGRSAELKNGSHIRMPQGSRSAGLTQEALAHSV